MGAAWHSRDSPCPSCPYQSAAKPFMATVSRFEAGLLIKGIETN